MNVIRKKLSFLSVLSASVALASFGDAHALELSEALAHAYENNPQLKSERARLRATDENVPQAYSGWLPTVTASYSRGRRNETLGDKSTAADPETVEQEQNSTHARTLSVSQPIFSGGETVYRTKRAYNLVYAGRANLRQVEQQILSQAVTAYADLVRTKKVLDLSIHNEEVLKEQLDATKERFQLGENTRTDVAQAESRQARGESDRIQAENNYISARAEYKRVVNMEAPDDVSMPATLPEIPSSLAEALALAMEHNYTLKAADYSARAAENAIKISLSGILPDVSLNGNIRREGGLGATRGSEIEDETITLNVSVPLYQSGVEYSRVRQARRTAESARMDLEDTRYRTEENVIKSWKDIETARASIKSNAASVESAKIALDGVKEEQAVGARTTLDVLDAEQEYFVARVNLVGAKRNEVVAVYNLLAAMGDLTAEQLDITVARYDYKEKFKDTEFDMFGF